MKVCLPLPLLLASMTYGGVDVYVDDDAPPGGDGLTWDTAYRFLNDALDAASAPAGDVDKIRVAQGTYRPDRSEASPDGTGDPSSTFQLTGGVVVTGGYLGLSAGEGQSPNDRDVELYATVLTGDLDPDSFAPRAYHVVTGSGTLNEAVLKGVTITRGFAGGEREADRRGGGLVIDQESVRLVDCRVVGNRSAVDYGTARGGGVWLSGSTLVLTMCTFLDNFASSMANDANGGAVSMAASVLMADETDFVTNSAGSFKSGAAWGGAITADAGSALTVTNCRFVQNTVSADAFQECGDAAGGAAFFRSSQVSLTNCLIVLNHIAAMAHDGAAVRAIDSQLALTNCTVASNSVVGCEAPEFGGIDATGDSSILLTSSVVWEGSVSSPSIELSHSMVDGEPGFLGPVGTWTMDAEYDPVEGRTTFTDQAANFTPGSLVGAYLQYGAPVGFEKVIVANESSTITVGGTILGAGYTGSEYLVRDYRPGPGSPLIDAGDTTAVPEGVTTDLAGGLRFVDDPNAPDSGSGGPPVVDIGAFEFQGLVCPADVDGDYDVDVVDLIVVITSWGEAGGPADIDEDGVVGVLDLIEIITNWGPCS